MGEKADEPLDCSKTISTGRRALSFYVPLAKLRSVAELMQMRDAAKGLREYIQSRATGDAGADDATLLRVLADIESSRRKVEYYMRVVSFFAGLVGIVPLAGPLFDKVVTATAKTYAENKFFAPYRWHFSLLDYSHVYSGRPLFTGTRMLTIPRREPESCRPSPRSVWAYTKGHRPCQKQAVRGTAVLRNPCETTPQMIVGEQDRRTSRCRQQSLARTFRP